VASSVLIWLKMWSELKDKMPEDLEEEDPVTVIEILILSSLECGVSQADLRSQLNKHRKKNLSQSVLSKLMDRLRREGWIDLARPTRDARERPMKTSRAGRKWMAKVEVDFDRALREALPVQKAHKRKPREEASDPRPVTLSFFGESDSKPQDDSVPNPGRGAVQR
jgi:DNA-binding MarR family transcriptional regulator